MGSVKRVPLLNRLYSFCKESATFLNLCSCRGCMTKLLGCTCKKIHAMLILVITDTMLCNGKSSFRAKYAISVSFFSFYSLPYSPFSTLPPLTSGIMPSPPHSSRKRNVSSFYPPRLLGILIYF